MFAQYFLRAFDGQPIMVQQFFDTTNKQHVLWSIISTAPSPFDRLDLRKLAFPEPQNMGRGIQPVCDLANGAECVSRFSHGSPQDLLPAATRSFMR